MRKVTVTPSVVRGTASAADLAADYKARGIDRQEAWSRFVQDKNLKPGMDAKEFYSIYDRVVPQELAGIPQIVDFQPTHFDEFKNALVAVTESEYQWRLLWPDGATGGYPKNQPLPNRFSPIG